MADRTVAYRFMTVVTAALLITGCGAVDEVEKTPEAASELAEARDAALRYLRVEFPDAPAVSLTWEEEAPAEEGVPGWMQSRFSADAWVISVGAAVLAP